MANQNLIMPNRVYEIYKYFSAEFGHEIRGTITECPKPYQVKSTETNQFNENTYVPPVRHSWFEEFGVDSDLEIEDPAYSSIIDESTIESAASASVGAIDNRTEPMSIRLSS